MKLRPEQLAPHLQKGPACCYWVSGDETLLVEEACALLRQTAAQHGFGDRQHFTVESSFDWGHFLADCQTGSLFSDKQLIELTLNQGKLDESGRTALETYLKNPDPDKILLVRSPKLDATQQKAAWYKTWDEKGVHITVYPLAPEQLAGWIATRLQQAGIKALPGVAKLLAEYVEGNLLAAAQEIEKLQLSLEGATLDQETLLAFISDHARFTVYDLADTALKGDVVKTARILEHLLAEGLEPPIILWALAREIRSLAQLQFALQKGESVGTAMQHAGVWEKRKPWFQAALKRQPATDWHALLLKAGEIDQLIKGAKIGNLHDELETLTLGLAGIKVTCSQRLDFWRGGSERSRGNVSQYLTDDEQTSNKAKNSNAKSIS